MKSNIKSVFLVAITIYLSLFLFSCKKIVNPRTELVFGTVCSVNAYNDGTQKLYDELFERLYKIDELFSTTKSNSEIEKINSAAGIEPVEVSDEVVFVLKIALSFARLTEGNFDPTIGPLVKLWGINTENAHVPSQEELSETLKLVNWKDVQIDGNSVYLPKKGMRLDLGGIVKGYAADALKSILKANGVKAAIIDLGGNIYVYGKKKDKSLWRVGIKNPDNPEGAPELVVSTTEATVVTSGVYERFFIQDGIRYHHILSPKTGYPVNNGILSASIICKSSTTADALSTSLFILGVEKGNALIDELKKMNADFESTKNSNKKEQISDGMGMWLFNGIPNEKSEVLELTTEGIPYLDELEPFSSVLETIFIDEENNIFISKDLQDFIKK